MKFEVTPELGLVVLCTTAREAEAITIKNSVLLRRLNELSTLDNAKYLAGSNITEPSQ
ncbi:MAG: hypothetical protein ACYC0G_00215 [Thiobacillus sp.]